MMPLSAKFRLPGLLACVLLPLSAIAGDFEVLRRFTLGGEGGWDYLSYDAPSHRL